MKIIRNLPIRIINGRRESWAEFECPVCLRAIEKPLSNGKIAKSCGCNQKPIKHGGKGTRLYTTWVDIKQRILNPNSKSFKNYGGRGITICNEWLEFIPFMEWSLSNGYTDNLTIDRIETNGNYEPNNCQWIPLEENSQKKRTTKLNQEIANEIRALHNIGNYTQKQLANKYNVSDVAISYIIHNKRWYKL